VTKSFALRTNKNLGRRCRRRPYSEPVSLAGKTIIKVAAGDAIWPATAESAPVLMCTVVDHVCARGVSVTLA
jgi:hypothetical protein